MRYRTHRDGVDLDGLDDELLQFLTVRDAELGREKGKGNRLPVENLNGLPVGTSSLYPHARTKLISLIGTGRVANGGFLDKPK